MRTQDEIREEFKTMSIPDLPAYIELSSQVPTYGQVPTYARRHRGTIHAADVVIERQGRTWAYTLWVDGLCASGERDAAWTLGDAIARAECQVRAACGETA